MSKSQTSEMELLHSEDSMSAVQNMDTLVLSGEETKFTIRQKIWEHFDKSQLVKYPKPYGRIPNFQAVTEASKKLLQLPTFTAAKSIGIYTDKPLFTARELTLTASKDLYVPFPRFQKCLMKKLILDEKIDVKMIVSHWGIQRTGVNIDVGDGVTIDLLVVGSVAVSKDGYRIGRGKGFEDLEYAVFKENKAINDETIIVTIVHDLQVFDTLPKDLFKKYDIPVDVIITPTRTIIVEDKLPRPAGIFWDELTIGQVKSRRLLQQLLAKHKSENRDTTLCVLTPENRHVRRPFYWRKFPKRPRPTEAINDNKIENGEIENKQNLQRHRKGKDTRGPKETNTENDENTKNSKNTPPKNKKKKKKHHIDYSLKVSNINRNIRTREFKQALKEKNIKPTSITWKGSRGVCFLHYAKKDHKKEDENSDAINDVIEKIQELKLNPSKPDSNLNVKVMEPITRIETVDVTAV